MKTITTTLLSLTLLFSTTSSAKMWTPWDNDNGYGNDNLFDSWMPWGNDNDDGYGRGSGITNWGPFDGGSNFGPFDGGNNWGPFSGDSNWGPFNSDSNWGPFNSDSNWGPFGNMNDMVNESDWGFYYNNKKSKSNT